MEGTYTSPSRVERDGVLVAFEGEVMTAQEAAERGLLPRGDDTASVVADAPAETGAEPGTPAKPPTNAELRAILDERGVPYDKKANKETLLALVESSEHADDAPADGAGEAKSGQGGEPGDDDDLYDDDDDDDGEDA